MAQSLARLVLRKSSQALAIKMVGAILSFLMFVALARSMSQNAYGIFGTVFSLVTLLAVVGAVGQRGVVLKFASAYDEQGRTDLLRGVYRSGYAQVIVGCTAAGAGGAVYIYAFVDQSASVAVGVLVLAITMGLVEFQGVAFRSVAGLWVALAPRDLIWRGLVIITAVASIAIVGGGVDNSTSWIWSFAIGLGIIATAQLLVFDRSTHLLKGQRNYDREAWRGPRLGLWISSATMAAVPGLAVLMVQSFVSTEDVGPFFAALRTAQMLNLLLLASTVVVAPTLSRTISRDDHEASQTVVAVAALASGLFGVFGFLVMAVFGRQLLNLFGPDFDSAYAVLLILASGFLLNTLAGPTGSLLEMHGGQNMYSALLLAFNAVSLAFMPIIVSIWGTLGAAWCIAFSAAGWNLAAWIYCRRKYGIDPTILSGITLLRERVRKGLKQHGHPPR